MTNPFIPHGTRGAARLAVLGLALAAALPAMAQPITIGPFLDFAGAVASTVVDSRLRTSTTITVEGSLNFTFPNGLFNPPVASWALTVPTTPCTITLANQFTCQSWTFKDLVTASPLRTGANGPDIPVKGLSYFSYDIGDNTGNVQVTTLYGQDVPNGSRLAMTGFDPVGPAVALSNEQIIGRSGAVFTPTVAAVVSQSDVHVVLGTHFDTSMLRGDPHGTLYVFQTNVPALELMAAVPEPGSHALLAGGLAVLGLRLGRRRTAIGAGGNQAASS